MAPLVQINPNIKKKNLILAIIIISLIIAVPIFLIMGDMDNIDEMHSRTEEGYTTKGFIIKDIKTVEIRSGKGGARLQNTYRVIEPQNEDIILTLPMLHRNTTDYSQAIEVGDSINVKLYTTELEDMRKSNPWKSLVRFVKGNDREVEVFALEVNGNTIFSKDITSSDINFRQGGDISANRIMLLIPFIIVIVGIIGVIRKKLAKRV